MKTDRELIEWLDGSVILHEAADVRDAKFGDNTAYDSDTFAKCSCGKWKGDLMNYHTHLSRMGVQQTLTLEFMLEKILRKRWSSIYLDGDGTEDITCTISLLNTPIVVAYGKTPTLALRGAVEKLMMEEEKDGSNGRIKSS